MTYPGAWYEKFRYGVDKSWLQSYLGNKVDKQSHDSQEIPYRNLIPERRACRSRSISLNHVLLVAVLNGNFTRLLLDPV